MTKERTTLTGSLNERDHANGMTQQEKQRRARRLAVVTTATVAAGTALLITAANSNSNTPSKKSSLKTEPSVTKYDCGVSVGEFGPNDTYDSTLQGLAGEFKVGEKDVKVYHPGNSTPESNPTEQMQPGDIAVAHIGQAACFNIGGTLIDPNLPGATE